MAASTIIPIQVEDDSCSGRSWILVELQGELKLIDGEASAWRDKCLGQLIGKDGDNPVLIIGSNKLEGKRMKLPKPFAILRRDGNEYHSQGIVTEKFVFKTRPKPLTVGITM